MIEKLLALAPKSTNRQLHFFVPFNFGVYSFLYMLQTLMKIQNTSPCYDKIDLFVPHSLHLNMMFFHIEFMVVFRLD